MQILLTFLEYFACLPLAFLTICPLVTSLLGHLQQLPLPVRSPAPGLRLEILQRSAPACLQAQLSAVPTCVPSMSRSKSWMTGTGSACVLPFRTLWCHQRGELGGHPQC